MKATIRRNYNGGSEDQTFQDFATQTIQEEGVARAVAVRMLGGDDPYEWNEDEAEFYETFTVLDPDELRRQLAER